MYSSVYRFIAMWLHEPTYRCTYYTRRQFFADRHRVIKCSAPAMLPKARGGGRLARVSAVDLGRSPVSLTCSSNRDCPLLFPAIVTRRSLKQLFYTFVCHLSGNDTRGSQDQPAVDDCTKLLFNRAHSKAEFDAVPDKDKDNVGDEPDVQHHILIAGLYLLYLLSLSHLTDTHTHSLRSVTNNLPTTQPPNQPTNQPTTHQTNQPPNQPTTHLLHHASDDRIGPEATPRRRDDDCAPR